MAGSGPSSSSSVYNSADEIDPMVPAEDAADAGGGASNGAKEKEALVASSPHTRRRRLWRFRNTHPHFDELGPPELFHPTWTSRLLRYFSPAAASSTASAQRRSARAICEAEAVPAAMSCEEEGPGGEPAVNETERFEEVGVACCLPCRRRKVPRSGRKLSSPELHFNNHESVVVVVARARASPAEVRLVVQPNNNNNNNNRRQQQQ